MRILLVSNTDLTTTGGVQTVVLALRKELIQRGHNVFLVSHKRAGIQVSAENDGRFGCEFLPFYTQISTLRGFLVAPFSIMNSIREIFIIVKKFKPDIINCHSLDVGSIICESSKIFIRCPLVHSLHGNDVEGELPKNPFWRKYAQILLRAIKACVLRRADFITTNSGYILKQAQVLARDNTLKGEVVGNGIYLSRYKTKLNREEENGYLLSIGSFVPKKGFIQLLKAYSLASNQISLPNLVIAGDGPEKKALIKKIEELNLKGKVDLPGYVFNEEKTNLFAGCFYFILPSHKEPFGIVVLETMASEKALICTKVGGVPEIVESCNCAILVPDKDPEAMSAAIIKLYQNENLRRQMGERGRKAVARLWTWDKITNKYEAIFNKII